MSEIIKNVEGEDVDKSHVALSMWMIDNKVNSIHVSYNGVGDSGEYAMQTKGIPENIIQIVYELIDSIVNPNFNNSGSYGEAYVVIEDGILKFRCDHSDIVETTDDTAYDEELLDTSML